MARDFEKCGHWIGMPNLTYERKWTRQVFSAATYSHLPSVKTATAPFFVFVDQNYNCKVSEFVWQREVANLGSMVARIQFQSQLCMSVSQAEGLHTMTGLSPDFYYTRNYL